MIDINGRLHSTEKSVNVVAGANEIFDDDKNKKQSEINTDTYSLVNDINEKLSGLSPEQQSALSVATKANKNEANLGYYVCYTESDKVAKVVFNATGYILAPGGSIKIKMTNANTADNATLNINSTGAKPLYYNGERASANNTWEAGDTIEVYYDGNNFYANNVTRGEKFKTGQKIKDVGIDTEPTTGSDNLVKSSGVITNILNKICPIVGFGPWQSIENDWKVGDIYAQYVTDHLEIRVVKAVTITETGTKIPLIDAINVTNTNILFLLNGEFYVINETGDKIIRQKDILGLLAKTGDLESLDTEAKTDIVAAINELVSAIEDLNNSFYYNELQEKRENNYWNTSNAVVGESWDGNSKISQNIASSIKLNVNSGDVFSFYGIGSNPNAVKTYVITDNNNIVLEISNIVHGTDYRTIPLEIVIPTNGKNLYVNFNNYVSTDKLSKRVKYDFAESIADITSNIGDLSNLTTEVKSNLVAAINELAVQCIKIGDLSELETTSKTNIVSAVNEIADKFVEENSVVQVVREGKYWNTKPGTSALVIGDTFDGNSKTSANTYSSEKVTVSAGEVYKYYGIGSNKSAIKTYVITDSTDIVLAISTIVDGTDYRTTPLDIVIPENGANLYVNFNQYNSATDELVKYSKQEIDLPQVYKDLEDCKSDIEELKKLPLYGKTIVCFGDSMTEFKKTGGKSYPEYLAEFSGATVINVGIGGTRFAQRATPTTTPTSNLEAMAACDICNMIKASCEQDFTMQIAGMQWEYDYGGYDKRYIIERLRAIDWSQVDIVVIAGGTNDWQSDQTVGTNGYSDFDVNHTLGAINYMLRLLTYTYPHIDVYFCGVMYQYKDDAFSKSFTRTRTFEIGEDTLYNGRLWRFTSAHSAGAWNPAEVRALTSSELFELSTSYIEHLGMNKIEYNNLILSEAKLSSVTVLDMYNNIWNAYNYTTALSSDLSHPLNGNDKLGKWVLSQILRNYKTA